MNEKIMITDAIVNTTLPPVVMSDRMKREFDNLLVPNIDGTNAGEYFINCCVREAEKSFAILTEALIAYYDNNATAFLFNTNQALSAAMMANECKLICREALDLDSKRVPFGRIIYIMLVRLASIVSDIGLYSRPCIELWGGRYRKAYCIDVATTI